MVARRLSLAVVMAASLCSSFIVQAQPEVSSEGIRVQLKPEAQMVVSSEISGRLSDLPFKEGDRFNKGQEIVGVACAIYQAKYRHSVADTTLAQQKYHIAKRLNKLESNSVLEVGQAQADLDKAQAEQDIAKVMVDRCHIKAPFSGRVSERMVEPGEFVSEGTKLLNIYSTQAYEVEMIVPSRWVRQLNVGQTFHIHLDETGKTYPATITRLGGVIDALSQSFKVFGEIKNRDGLLLMPGMSGNAQLSVVETKAVRDES